MSAGLIFTDSCGDGDALLPHGMHHTSFTTPKLLLQNILDFFEQWHFHVSDTMVHVSFKGA